MMLKLPLLHVIELGVNRSLVTRAGQPRRLTQRPFVSFFLSCSGLSS